MHPPFSQACENNQGPILEVLKRHFGSTRNVLEIGSGTGQHSVHFASRMPHLVWQTSDLAQNHAGILAWHAQQPASNLRAPLVFDLSSSKWPAGDFDAAFTSNTAHIVSWPLVERMFALVGSSLPAGGLFVIYGPFNYGGAFTSDSNRAFDAMLRERDPASGIRHFEDIVALAQQHGLQLIEDNAMPANNRTLVFAKSA